MQAQLLSYIGKEEIPALSRSGGSDLTATLSLPLPDAPEGLSESCAYVAACWTAQLAALLRSSLQPMGGTQAGDGPATSSERVGQGCTWLLKLWRLSGGCAAHPDLVWSFRCGAALRTSSEAVREGKTPFCLPPPPPPTGSRDKGHVVCAAPGASSADEECSAPSAEGEAKVASGPAEQARPAPDILSWSLDLCSLGQPELVRWTKLVEPETNGPCAQTLFSLG